MKPKIFSQLRKVRPSPVLTRSILFQTLYGILFGQIFFCHAKEINVTLYLLIMNVVNLYEFVYEFIKLLGSSMQKHTEVISNRSKAFMCFKKCKLLCNRFWVLKTSIRIWDFMLNDISNSYCTNLITVVKLPCLIHRLPLNYISAHLYLLSDFLKMSAVFNILGKFFFHVSWF